MTIPKLKIPLSPYIQPGKRKPRQSIRVRPEDTLDLQTMVAELEPNTILTLDIDGKPWSVVNVFSAYSFKSHVMLVEVSRNRAIFGPEDLAQKWGEGELLMEAWASILDWMEQDPENQTLCVGYNWSPFSWGKKEESTGYQ